MQQHTIKPAESQTKKRTRVGRGNAAGKGTYCGRGVKGQSARSGGKRRPGFEGGQTPLIRLMPKLPGFRHPHVEQKTHQPINLSDLEANFDNGEAVTKIELKAKGLITSLKRPIKLLGKGTISKKLTITVTAASASAIAAIEAIGGQLILPPVVEKVRKRDKKLTKMGK
ncbi:50S ribosomal protein L15 [Candidatus Peregrinibacteria bacterium CG11_big_fil_rev_8_21_14_0_20_41_10]|nr:MAG: 50S ribosomal protein L15 [Candidatus Peregrinibacteria bacterium CG11_big_fil_rev_8_21_14_0_20_41_10]PIZ76776.1 MAG: 50S ribosomal protein L15 [Candidatus Peregrinibacteria bacterium CG_4_10_14_0_2_um_filter_41_8]PJC37979.1 MAG: 50S ribosomal protein L15 [Candidatus Peregrinibacteria bacterium CG_4_9_14_0_2_um_filter_41_14]